jgi:hypothetical protein
MTLSECMKKHDLVGCRLADCYVVYPGKAFPADLWALSDFTVSSNSGGCIWLTVRNG